MRVLARLLSLAMLAVSAVLSLAVWDQTGRLPDTRAPSAELAQMAEPNKDADDPFAGLGMDDAAGKPKAVENHFRLGLIPGMSSWRDMAAVSTITLPSLVLTVMVFVATRKKKA